MTGYTPILTFDTSAINNLADDADSDVLIANLTSALQVRLTFTSISEVIATNDGGRRRKLLGVYRRLLSSGDCIDPQNELLMKLTASFEESPFFDWTKVDVSLPGAENGISCEENFSDNVSAQARTENNAIETQIRGVLRRRETLLRPPVQGWRRNAADQLLRVNRALKNHWCVLDNGK